MSRSGYNDYGDIDNWDLIRWRGAVTSAIRGKRGQAFLREMKEALLALPEKKLIYGRLASGGQVCSLGAVMLARKIKAGTDAETALKEIEEEWPSYDEYSDDDCGDDVSAELDIAGALAKEIMFLNDEDFFGYSISEEVRYRVVLKWVQSEIKDNAML